MPFLLPVTPARVSEPDNPETDGLKWELAAPEKDAAPILGPREGTVTNRRTGPGDMSLVSDQWMDPDIYVVPRAGVMNGEQLFVMIPNPPPEGHGGYDPMNQGPVIDHSTTRQALFWSDWYSSTAANAGGGGSFRGEHVVIIRQPGGSVQGYMPSDPGMEQLNNRRQLPTPWDAVRTLGS